LPAPTPEQREYAELLLEHAMSDLGARRVLMAAEGLAALQSINSSLMLWCGSSWSTLDGSAPAGSRDLTRIDVRWSHVGPRGHPPGRSYFAT
jgi:hypothetical protein